MQLLQASQGICLDSVSDFDFRVRFSGGGGLGQIATHDHESDAGARLVAQLMVASLIVVGVLAHNISRLIGVLGMRHLVGAEIKVLLALPVLQVVGRC